ncbi:uncharacterized protein LOC135961541 [Calliphora vicina]|uniref:uncharacterized protein LOC135961541 n=1 Tax=Calliphora vicina TaxID=7373 RepID=UPI00325A4458
MATKWFHSSPYAPLPPNAVVGGYDTDGSVIYVGRSYHEGNHLPVKVIPSKRAAYISWAGGEHAKSHYELLVGENYTWQPCFGANIPPNAIQAGETVNGSEPLFIGRGHYGNSLVVGKIQPSHACLYIPFAGEEIKLDKYEVLVYGGAGVNANRPEESDLIKFEDHKWIHSSAYANLPPNAVVGGNDVDGDMIYVGRAFHDGDMLVAKVIPAKKIAFVSFRGAEIPKDHFEILCGRNLVWRHCYNHIIPDKAVLCGRTALGQPVYIGRGHYEGSLTVGKISSVHKALFIPFRGVERRLETYEILVEEKLIPGWQVSVSTDPLPPPPPPAMTPEKPYPYPPVQTPYPYPEMKPPMPMPTPIDPPPPYVAVAPCMPMPSPSPNYPTPACRFPKPTPHYPTPTPAETYPGPSEHFPNPPPPSYAPSVSRPYNMWISAHPGSTPGNAVHAGHDIDMTTIYVCRAYHNGNLLPGKAVPGRSCAYISYQGKEIQKPNYEMLVGEHYMWVPAIHGFAMGAVEAGRTECGEPLYVGRAHYNGSLTCGKIRRSHDCLYIPFGGREIRIAHGYEILVDRNQHNHGHNVAICYFCLTTIRLKVIQMAIKWFPSSTTDLLPRNVVGGGYDSDGSPIYIGRSYHEGCYLPVKVIPSKKSAYVSWGGVEHFKTNYDLLVGDNYSWQPRSFTKETIPSNAVSTGQTSSGESIFIGRGQYENCLTVGNIVPTHGCLYIHVNDMEIKLLSFEILICCDDTKKALTKSIASKFSPDKELPEPTFQVTEVRAVPYCEPNYSDHLITTQPQPLSQPAETQPDATASSSNPQPNVAQPVAAAPSSTSAQPDYDVWALAQPDILPPDAVHAGYDIDGQLIYVSRVFHNGDFIPAKAFPSCNLACVPFQGQEIVKSNFEFLIGKNYMWVSPYPFPTGAVVVNPISTNEALYVGRSNYGGSLLCGKFQRSQNCLYVPFGRREIPITSAYEILVHKDRYSSASQQQASSGC